jgi:hypothetical protein
MKRTVLLIAASLCLSLWACGPQPDDQPDTQAPQEGTQQGGKGDLLGEDDRRDWYSYEEGSMPRRVAQSTAMILYSNMMEPGPGQAQVSLRAPGTLGRKANLCEDQPFAQQPAVGFCTAFLVAPDLVLTAGHCLVEAECPQISLVFGFGYEQEPAEPVEALRTFSQEQVYGCAEFVAQRSPSQCGDADALLIRLDRPVEGRQPLPWRRSGQPEVGTPLFMVGHPDGLPSKIATGTVRAVQGEVFKDDLDSFGGNSGSPVFNAETGVIEGIRSCASGEHSVPNPEDASCNILYQCFEDDPDCDFVLGTSYAISEVDYILEAVLGLEPAPEGDQESPGAPCCAGQSGPGCQDEQIAACVCAEDDFCCTGQWDGACAAKVTELGCGVCP